jgi:HlyD family secretion protein
MRGDKTAMRVGCALLTAALAASALSGCGHKPGPAAATNAGDARAARVVAVESRQMQGGATVSGLLISREEAAVGSDLAGYRILRVNVEQGAWVKQGQPLVELDDSLLKAQIAQQQALTAQAQDQAKRVADLDNLGVMSAQDITSRRLQAKAQEAALQDLMTREAHMTIRAPVSGLVLERNVRPGDISSVGGATPMFRMVRDGLVELNAEVPQDSMSRIRIGDPAEVSLPDGTIVAGRVRLVDPQVDSTTKLGHVRIALPVRADLRPGGFARATFTGVSPAARSVPETAVRYDADGASVAVVGADDRVTITSVKTGRRSGGYVELLDGPPAGSLVLLRAASFVLPGDKVTPIHGAESAPVAAAANPSKGG